MNVCQIHGSYQGSTMGGCPECNASGLSQQGPRQAQNDYLYDSRPAYINDIIARLERIERMLAKAIK